jgi:sensor c-di-GMP phosphodiesterase-like protein
MHENDALWRHVVSMANTLSLTIVAEGVEQEVQACALINEGVTFAQGWLYAKDLPPETLAKQFFHIRA